MPWQSTRWQGDDDLVFGEPDTGDPLRRGALMRRYRRALKAALLDPEARFHDLRHTFGTAMAGAGVPMRTLQEWMGHRDIATTQIYADYAPNAREAELVEAAFATTSRPPGPMPSAPSIIDEGLPRPLRKRIPPKPQAVTIRRIGDDEPVEVIGPDELAWRKDDEEWQRYRRAHGLDVWDEHELLALQLGSVIASAGYTGPDLWWFVVDVNGIERRITARTRLFGTPYEQVFSFDVVEPLRLSAPGERNDAWIEWQSIRGVARCRRLARRARQERREAA